MGVVRTVIKKSTMKIQYASEMCTEHSRIFEEQIELLEDYGYTWGSFANDRERNQIICEIYFEEYS